MPHFEHCGKGRGPSCRIYTWDFQWLYINFSHSLPNLWDLIGYTSTENATEVRTWGKDITYVSLYPILVSTSQVWANLLPWMLYVWCQSDHAAIVTPHLLQINLFRLRPQRLSPSPIEWRLCESLPSCLQMNPGVHAIALVFPGFMYIPTFSNVHTSVVSAPCTQMGFLPTMRPLSAQNTMSWSPSAHPIPWWYSWGPQTSRNVACTTALANMLKMVEDIGYPLVTPW